VRELFAGWKRPRRTLCRIGFQPVQPFVALATKGVFLFMNASLVRYGFWRSTDNSRTALVTDATSAWTGWKPILQTESPRKQFLARISISANACKTLPSEARAPALYRLNKFQRNHLFLGLSTQATCFRPSGTAMRINYRMLVVFGLS
jgi:hypothetical protein